MPNINNKQVLCDFWYSQNLGDIVLPFEKYAAEKMGPRLARFLLRFSALRALLLIWFGRDFTLIAPDWYRYGRLICVLQGILRNRNLVIFECIDFAIWSKGPIIAAAVLFMCKYVIGPCMRASVVAVQVMTNWELRTFVERYGVPEEMLHMVPWPLGWESQLERYGRREYVPQALQWPLGGDSNVHNPAGPARDGFVLSSGRNSCDYETLFAAAHFGNWPLCVVCKGKDLTRVATLNKNGRAKVFCELAPVEHQRLVAGATIYVLCLKENFRSAGHVRLSTAIAAGTPVVASNALGLEGYLIDGVTAIAVEPGNPAALARAIENLMKDPERREALTESATKYAAKFTKQDYFSALRQILTVCLERNRR